MDQISNIPKIEVKRHYSIDFNKNTKLHIFADLSNLVYGAVAYFRVQHENNFTASFIIGKSRLAPLSKNTLTIPKLELQAAVMTTRLKEISRLTISATSKKKINSISNQNGNQ